MKPLNIDGIGQMIQEQYDIASKGFKKNQSTSINEKKEFDYKHQLNLNFEIIPGVDCQIKELKLYPRLRQGFDGFRISIDGVVRTGGHTPQQFANFERKLTDAFKSISID